MSASSNTYQLNTKAGGTTSVNATETTLINAGQFAIGAIKAKAEAATFNTTTFDLTYPGGIVTVA